MKKKVMLVMSMILALTFSLLLISACGEEEKKAQYQIFYINIDGTKIVPKIFRTDTGQGEELLQEFLAKLTDKSGEKDLRQAVPEKVKIQKHEITGAELTIDFESSYTEQTPVEEVLCRAAVVKTLLQLNDIRYVRFTVNGNPIMDVNGKEIGRMAAGLFVENPGKQINTTLRTDLTLYFASQDGARLEKETRRIHYSSNVSIEKLVVEQLIEGPKETGMRPVIPSGTRLLTVSVADGICYVNFDETFRNQNDEITEQAVLYSIVNSLTELPTISKVQISVNGDTKGKLRYDYNLLDIYKRDLSILVTEEPVTEESSEGGETSQEGSEGGETGQEGSEGGETGQEDTEGGESGQKGTEGGETELEGTEGEGSKKKTS